VGDAVLSAGPLDVTVDPEWTFDSRRRDQVRAAALASGGVERIDLSDVWTAPRPVAWQGLGRWLTPLLLLALLPNRTLCLRRTRRYPRRRLAHLRLRPTCVPLASSSLALDASFALGRPCASFLIWMPCASILFWRPQSMFGCPRPCCAPFPSSSPFGRDSPLNWMPSALDLLTLLRLLPYLDASLPSRSLTMPRTCMRNFSHVLHFAHRVTFHIGSPSMSGHLH
jgi:hypothetical protein